MSGELGFVMIVDDSDADNFLNRLLLERDALPREVRDFSYACDALNFLKSDDRPDVDLILIDINMPRMNGFEFADEFSRLFPEQRGDATVIMASGSLNPSDEARAKEHPAIDGYLVKPISVAKVKEIVDARIIA